MAASSDNVTDLTTKPGARGRRDSDGQEKTPEPAKVEKLLPNLIKLYEAKVAAAEALSDATKKAAEKSGFNTSALKKFVKARAEADGSEEDPFDDRKREAEQLVLLFEKVGSGE